MLVPIDDLRIRAGLTAGDSSQDNEITGAYEVALSVIESYCDRRFELDTEEEVFAHSSGYSLQLKRFPIITVNSLSVNEPATAPDYHFQPDNGILFFDGLTTSHVITINYDGGYTELTCPKDLQLAVKSVFDLIWNLNQTVASDADEFGAVKQAKIGDLSLSFDAAGSSALGLNDSFITPGSMQLLSAYKRYSA